MKEPSPSAASIEEEDRDALRRSKERSQGDGDVRQMQEAKWMKGKGEEKNCLWSGRRLCVMLLGLG